MSQSSEHKSTVRMQAAVLLETLVMRYQPARSHIIQFVNFHEPCQKENVKFYAVFGCYKCLLTYALESVAMSYAFCSLIIYLFVSLISFETLSGNHWKQTSPTQAHLISKFRYDSYSFRALPLPKPPCCLESAHMPYNIVFVGSRSFYICLYQLLLCLSSNVFLMSYPKWNSIQYSVKKDNRKESVGKWQSQWEETKKGAITKEFFPSVESRLAVNLNLSPNVTKIMTGHGNIRSYLHRLKFIGSPEYPCKHGTQTADHLIFQCKRLKSEREILKNGVLKVGNWPVSKSEQTNRNLKQLIR